MTFAEGVLRLVRSGARIDRQPVASVSPQPVAVDAAAVAETATGALDLLEALEAAEDGAEVEDLAEFEPGFADLEAAVALVEAGLATRVVLTGFPSWPGLLWQAYQLAEAANVMILPTVVRPGGRVDIVIARGNAADG
jgi:hypothetical protein